MATTIDAIAGNRPGGRGYMADQAFFTRYAIFLAAFILFGFIQFELRGFVDIRTVPPIFHLHGAVMVSWLALGVVQNLLISKMQVKTHRTVGWIGAALAVAVVAVGMAAGRAALGYHSVPPFFTNAYFLSLTHVEPLLFALTVAWAIAKRRDTQWHRRLMLASTILIAEPALGRLLPIPLLGGWGEWVILAVQLLFVAVLTRHDRKQLGHVHPATLAGAGVLVASHVLVTLAAMVPAVQSAAALAGA
ncbi:hypothetical protein ABDK56_04240 [Sphingomonas sp. ASV193]|uniref:hypothetical protein n=1 Tax=Sphingomonas sp. ASV193 TaxID=3144405 RepID=UPI0032E884BF